jgi:hypothetical protein
VRHDTVKRFCAKFPIGGSGCWGWEAAKDTTGYGRFWDGSRVVPAHRVSYELFVGPITEGLHIDHLCRNRGCVNPSHLEPVTQRENMMRGVSPAAAANRRTSCVHGHEYTAENTYLWRGSRHCMTCRRGVDRARSLRAASR